MPRQNSDLASTTAILFQPVMGLEIAGLALAAAGVNIVFLLKLRGEYNRGKLWNLAVGVVIVGLTSLLWVVPMIAAGVGPSLEAEEFVHIYGHFRHPHHLIPSAWDTTEWMIGAAFIVAVVIALIETFRAGHASADEQYEHMARGLAVAAILGLVAEALVVGYVFVEIMPTRIATTAQTFRMVVFVAWHGWILMAGVAARLLVRGSYHWAALFIASAVSVPTLFAYKVTTFISVASLALERYDIFPSNIPRLSSYVEDRQPTITMDEAMDGYRHDHIVELAAVARENTDPDSVFLVPWNWQVWRLFSERGIVVDQKAFPSRDEAMKEWYERYLAIYDDGAGYPDDVTESELLELQDMYGFDYAVARSGPRMPSFPVLKSSGSWRLVRVTDAGPG